MRTLDADAVSAGGRTFHFLVMEYFEGRTLRELLDDMGRVPDPGAALAALASHEERIAMEVGMHVRFLLWQATRDPAHVAEAERRLDFIVEHAPPDCRESMLANVCLHREIAEAARAAGIRPARPRRRNPGNRIPRSDPAVM